MDRKKTCSVCGKSRWLEDLEPVGGKKNAAPYKRKSYCKACKKKKGTAGAVRRRVDKYRTWDRQRGYEGTLGAEDLRAILEQECVWCGNPEDITADRLDNAKGHTVENCVPACYACNAMRSNMPLEAWLVIAPAVGAARRLGLLAGWNSRGFGLRNAVRR